MTECLPAVIIGNNVELNGGGRGKILTSHNNLGFKAYEVETKNHGESCNRVYSRYRVDLRSKS